MPDGRARRDRGAGLAPPLGGGALPVRRTAQWLGPAGCARLVPSADELRVDTIAKLEAVHAAMITAGNDSGAGDTRILYATGAS
jgi:hypothetical protein